MLVRKWMKHFQVAVTASFDAKTIPGSINCYTAKMSQFRQQLRGHMVGPPCWLTSYLRLTSLHPEVELSRTSHYHQRIISRHQKTSKNILRQSTFLLKKTPTWPWNCRILECIRVLASAFTWSHHVLQVYQIRSTTSTHASRNGDIFWLRRSSTCNILMVISTASAPKDNNILFGGASPAQKNSGKWRFIGVPS